MRRAGDRPVVHVGGASGAAGGGATRGRVLHAARPPAGGGRDRRRRAPPRAGRVGIGVGRDRPARGAARPVGPATALPARSRPTITSCSWATRRRSRRSPRSWPRSTPAQRATAFIEVQRPQPTSCPSTCPAARRSPGSTAATSGHATAPCCSMPWSAPSWTGRCYAWGGGESRAMARVRRHLHDERGLDPSCTEVIAYWRQGAQPGGARAGRARRGRRRVGTASDLTVRQVGR